MSAIDRKEKVRIKKKKRNLVKSVLLSFFFWSLIGSHWSPAPHLTCKCTSKRHFPRNVVFFCGRTSSPLWEFTLLKDPGAFLGSLFWNHPPNFHSFDSFRLPSFSDKYYVCCLVTWPFIQAFAVQLESVYICTRDSCFTLIAARHRERIRTKRHANLLRREKGGMAKSLNLYSQGAVYPLTCVQPNNSVV